MKQVVQNLLMFLIRFFLGGVFVLAGYNKITQPMENFRGLLSEYTILPYFIIPTIAWMLPWLEIIAGVFLILGFLTRYSAALLAFFSFGFAVTLIASKIILGISPESCGCFGENIQLTVNQVVILDTVNVLIGGFLFSRKKNHPWSLDARMS